MTRKDLEKKLQTIKDIAFRRQLEMPDYELEYNRYYGGYALVAGGMATSRMSCQRMGDYLDGIWLGLQIGSSR